MKENIRMPGYIFIALALLLALSGISPAPGAQAAPPGLRCASDLLDKRKNSAIIFNVGALIIKGGLHTDTLLNKLTGHIPNCEPEA